MIDAYLFAVRDNIRSAGFGYGEPQCDIMDDGHPPPRVGNIFIAVYEMSSRSTAKNNLDERYAYGVTLTMRVSVPVDRIGNTLLASKLARTSVNGQPSFNARMEQLRGFLHMNWQTMGVFDAVNTWTPKSANANIMAWSPTTINPVYGFVEPAAYTGRDKPEVVGGEWFGSTTPEASDVGLKCELRFDGSSPDATADNAGWTERIIIMTPETIFLRDGSQVVLIHYSTAINTLACMPGLTKLSADPNGRIAPHMRSEEKSVVTCPMCRQTVAFTGCVPQAVAGKR